MLLNKLQSFLSNPFHKREFPKILAYHRVCKKIGDPQLLSVKPETFEKQVAFFAEHYSVITLERLIRGISQKEDLKNSLVITFDDGYADNYQIASRILSKYNLPATFFVTSGYINSKKEFWWDELEHLVFGAINIPLNFSLQISNIAWKWDSSVNQNDNADIIGKLSDTVDIIPYPHWNVLLPYKLKSREHLYLELHKLLKPLKPEIQRSIMDQIRDIFHYDPKPRPENLSLSEDELISLASSNLFEVGAHTINHVVLANLTEREQTDEIYLSKLSLTKVTGVSVKTLSYPYGNITDIGNTAIGLVKETGFLGSCANFSGKIDQNTDVFMLPRYLVRDWDIKTLKNNFNQWNNE